MLTRLLMKLIAELRTMFFVVLMALFSLHPITVIHAGGDYGNNGEANGGDEGNDGGDEGNDGDDAGKSDTVTDAPFGYSGDQNGGDCYRNCLNKKTPDNDAVLQLWRKVKGKF